MTLWGSRSCSGIGGCRSLGVPWSLLSAVVATSLLGCCSTEVGEEGPLVISELGVRKSTVYIGGVMVIEATLEAQAPATNVALDFYATPAASPSCASPEHLLRHVTVPAIATGTTDLPDVNVVHQRLDKTAIVYDKGVGNRRAKVTRTLLLPEIPEGSYYLAAVAAAGAERSCKLSATPIAVRKPTGPQIAISSVSLGNHSFSLPTEEYRPLPSRQAPAFSVSLEAINTGLDATLPAGASFTLELGGKSYPLLIELTNEHGTPALYDSLVLVDGETEQPGAGPTTFHQDEVRGGTANVYLGEEAVTALAAGSGETTAVLKLVVDKDNKLGQMDRSEATASFDVIHQPLAAGNETCKTPAGYDNVVFCFGPTGFPFTQKWGTDSIYVEYSLAGNADDPSYFAYNAIDKVIPSAATFHAASWVKVGKSFGHPTVKTPVDALVEMDYILPPPQGDDTFFKFDGHLKILGETIFDYSKTAQVKMTKEKDFTFYKKQKTWKIYRDTVMVGPVPVTFDFNATGELGLNGSAYVGVYTNEKMQPSANIDFKVGPYAKLTAAGEVAVGIILFQAGVGVSLTLVDLEPQFATAVTYFPSSSQSDRAVLLSGSVPLTLSSLGGKFYAFVKVLVKKWKTTIVAWNGLRWVLQVVAPRNFFFGPAGELIFTDTVNNVPTSTQVGEVYHSPQAGHSYKWEAKVHLKPRKYNLTAVNLGHVTLADAGGQTVFDDKAASCGKNAYTTSSFTPTTEADYTLVAVAEANCYKVGGNPMSLYLAEDGDAAVIGDSGRFSSGEASGARSIWTEYCNTSAGNWGPPVYYSASDSVKLSLAHDQPFKTGTVKVNSPDQGLGVQWSGPVPLEVANQKRDLVFSFEGNPAFKDGSGCTVVDSLRLLVWGNGRAVRKDVTVTLDSNGKAMVVVTGLQNDTDPWFGIRYHPASPGDNPNKCTMTSATDANLKMSLAPANTWLVKQNLGKEDVFSLQAGPASADNGTLAGGSLHIRATQDKPYYLNNYASGLFNFANGGPMDFFVGATSSADYTVWIDGVRVASRSLASDGKPYDPKLDPDNGWNVRETLLTTDVTPGYHRIEMFTDQSAAAAYSLRTALVTRLRWSPRTPSSQAILHFYKTSAELQAAVNPDASLRQSVQPILLMKDTSSSEMKLTWRGTLDCTAANNNQVDCSDSLQWGIVNVLWDGSYLLQPETDYYVETSPTGYQGGGFPMFYFDDQQYFEYFASNVQLYPFRGGAYHAILTSKPLQDEYASEPTSNKMAWGPDINFSPQSPLALDMKWTALPANTYKVLFFDNTSRLLSTFTGDYTKSSDANGQRFCIGTGKDIHGQACPQPSAIPADAAYVVVVASTMGDPQGKYYSETDNPAIDAILNIDVGWSPTPNWFWCLTNSCIASVSKTSASSAEFLHYVNSADVTQRQGLFSRQRNAFLFYFSCSHQGCAADYPILNLSQTYQAHQW